MRCLVAGAGGFIGGHLVRRLLDEGHEVRAVDIKSRPQWWQVHEQADNRWGVDLRTWYGCLASMRGMEDVYNLACDMGGIGFIETHKAQCMTSVLINTHLLLAARECGARRYFFSSSACAYHADLQKESRGTRSLREEDAYYNGGAMPEDGYGWEKLFSERMCRHFMEDYGLKARVARFHNIYGPHGSWDDGREKAPAALCRKVAEAKWVGKRSIEVWGDGTKTRSFCYVDDCVEGILRLMQSDVEQPLNVGSSELVSIEQLLCLIEGIAEHDVDRNYDLSMPQGVAGRNSDNTKIKALLGWEPTTPLRQGLASTYAWVEQQVKEKAK